MFEAVVKFFDKFEPKDWLTFTASIAAITLSRLCPLWCFVPKSRGSESTSFLRHERMLCSLCLPRSSVSLRSSRLFFRSPFGSTSKSSSPAPSLPQGGGPSPSSAGDGTQRRAPLSDLSSRPESGRLGAPFGQSAPAEAVGGRIRPLGVGVCGLDDTIERRRGDHMQAKGIDRDPVRSSRSHFWRAPCLILSRLSICSSCKSCMATPHVATSRTWQHNVLQPQRFVRPAPGCRSAFGSHCYVGRQQSASRPPTTRGGGEATAHSWWTAPGFPCPIRRNCRSPLANQGGSVLGVGSPWPTCSPCFRPARASSWRCSRPPGTPTTWPRSPCSSAAAS